MLLAAADTVVRQQRKLQEELMPQPPLPQFTPPLPSPALTAEAAPRDVSPLLSSSPFAVPSPPATDDGVSLPPDSAAFLSLQQFIGDEYSSNDLFESLFDFSGGQQHDLRLEPHAEGVSLEPMAPSDFSGFVFEANLDSEMGFPFEFPADIDLNRVESDLLQSSPFKMEESVPRADGELAMYASMDLDKLLSSLGLPLGAPSFEYPTPAQQPSSEPEYVYFKDEHSDSASPPPETFKRSSSCEASSDRSSPPASSCKAPKSSRRKLNSDEPGEGSIIMPGYARNRGTAPKKYQCHQCGHLFSRRYNLVTHARVHEDSRDRPYVCSEPGCGATFYRPPDLQRHATVHTKDKPYQCADCLKWFTRKDALKRHIYLIMQKFAELEKYEKEVASKPTATDNSPPNPSSPLGIELESVVFSEKQLEDVFLRTSALNVRNGVGVSASTAVNVGQRNHFGAKTWDSRLHPQSLLEIERGAEYQEESSYSASSDESWTGLARSAKSKRRQSRGNHPDGVARKRIRQAKTDIVGTPGGRRSLGAQHIHRGKSESDLVGPPGGALGPVHALRDPFEDFAVALDDEEDFCEGTDATNDEEEDMTTTRSRASLHAMGREADRGYLISRYEEIQDVVNQVNTGSAVGDVHQSLRPVAVRRDSKFDPSLPSYVRIPAAPVPTSWSKHIAQFVDPVNAAIPCAT
ncbi:hypothetical protein HDU93_000613 [Gonapodya sp. JEL0774]|nr:hypothetical protein HDU93_000613 [Gonapodya sp. JEL0774]